MANHRNILVAVEFTPETRVITEKAEEVTDLYQAQLSLINVVEFSNTFFPPEVVLPDEFDMVT